MRTRTVREGSAGLLILVGIAFFGGLGLWLRGFNPNNRSYRVIVEFASARGIQVGTAVRYRGVTVGKIRSIRPGSNGVDVELQISPADLIIPRDVSVEATQSGLIGETFIDIIPQENLAQGSVNALPLAPNCNTSQIVCNGARLRGQAGASVDELIRTSIRFTRQLSDPAFIDNIKAATRNASAATAGITRLSNELVVLTQAVKQEIGPLAQSARTTANTFTLTADRFGLTASQINNLLAENRATLSLTLNNLSQTSEQLRVAVRSLNPVISRVEQGELLQNLEQLSLNAAQASANLRDLSTKLNDPTVIVRLQQTLDSARATFENAQKITSDLDELTGDPRFRSNLRNLVNGLSNLVSSAEQLQDQAMVAQVLTPLSTTSPAQAGPVSVPVLPSPNQIAAPEYTVYTSGNRLKAIDDQTFLAQPTLDPIKHPVASPKPKP